MSVSSKAFDGLLVLQYRSGKKNALNLLVKRYHKKLCWHSYSYTHDIDASKDLVQDCWSTIIIKLDSLNEPNRFGSWAFRIVTRKSLDFVKRRKLEAERLDSYKNAPKDDSSQVHSESEIQRLKITIQVLPKDQQTVLRLFYTEEYSLKEISEILEISVGTVKSRLFHAREKLKTILKT